MDDDFGVASTGLVGVGHSRTHRPRPQDRSQGDPTRLGGAEVRVARAAANAIGPYEPYLRERVAAWPELSGVRLLREVRERGYAGGVTRSMTSSARSDLPWSRPSRSASRPGCQAQVDFMVEFTEQPGLQHRVWLFAMVLVHSRYLWGQYVLHQDLGTVLRCHMLAFEHFGGTPLLYERMKTAVLGEATDDTALSTTTS
jgi:transposase